MGLGSDSEELFPGVGELVPENDKGAHFLVQAVAELVPLDECERLLAEILELLLECDTEELLLPKVPEAVRGNTDLELEREV